MRWKLLFRVQGCLEFEIAASKSPCTGFGSLALAVSFALGIEGGSWVKDIRSGATVRHGPFSLHRCVWTMSGFTSEMCNMEINTSC